MKVIKMTRDEYLESVMKIEDFDTLKFAKSSMEWWDNYYSWNKFPPYCLVENEMECCYLFFSISKDNEYLTIHNIFTPKEYRFHNYAYKLLDYLFTELSNKNINRFKMFCVSSSLEFYNKLGLEYWGVNDSGQYYCDYKMPKKSITEIANIVKSSSLDELSDERIEDIYEMLNNNGSELETKRADTFDECLERYNEKYHFDKLCERFEKIKNK